MVDNSKAIRDYENGYLDGPPLSEEELEDYIDEQEDIRDHIANNKLDDIKIERVFYES